MKKLLYFLIGFFSSVFTVGLSYADCQYDPTVASHWVTEHTYLGTVHKATYQTELQTIGDGSWMYQSHNTFLYAVGSYHTVFINVALVRHYPYDNGPFRYVWFVDGQYSPADLICVSLPDADGDGIPDEYDFYPDDPDPYSVKMTSFQTTDNTLTGDKSYACYETDRGDTFCTGTDGVLNGATDYVIADGIWRDGADIVGPTGSNPAPPGDISDPNPTVIDHPGADVPSTGSDGGDSDSDSWRKIVGNTDATNKNLKSITDALGITNNLLGKIKNSSGGGLFFGLGTETAPTADEIGQAVNDKLIDPGETIDKTITDNIPDLDETETLTAINTKYSDRYDLFITTLKESDLFSLPFSVFDGPSGSGVSIQTVNIGKWGSTAEQTATIDYSDYDNIWDILRSVLLLLTSFSCFKIMVLKKA